MSTIQYIRDHYRVPVKRGRRVSYVLIKDKITIHGVITGAATVGAYLWVRRDDGVRTLHHPEAVTYYDDDGHVLWSPDEESQP